MNSTTEWTEDDGRILALCGGIGGAKLALGLSRVVPADNLAIAVNTGDDFRHFGLHVSPDIDTVLYTLAGLSNPEVGWGRKDESWRFMQTVAELSGETWFSLGDTDLAISAIRTARLQGGSRLTDITRDFARALGIAATILPASDDPLETVVDTSEGVLPFQRYFVGRRCEPQVRGLRFVGADTARPSPELTAALGDPRLAAIVLCPSNPYFSIDPILALEGIRPALAKARAPVIAVSPLVGNQAIKGPLTKLMGELGVEISLQSIADHYRAFLDVLVVDEVDAGVEVAGPRVVTAKTVMRTLEDRIALARTVLDIARQHGRMAGR